MKKCLNCQREYPDEQIYCNECGSTLQIENTQSNHKKNKLKSKGKKGKTTLIIAIVSTFLACLFLGVSIYLYSELIYYQEEYYDEYDRIYDLNQELEEYENKYSVFEDLEDYITIGTSQYHTEKYIISISPGKYYSIPIYCSRSGTCCFSSVSEDLEVTWSNAVWKNNTKDVNLYASARGIYTIRFFMKDYSDNFTVLVIVN